MSLRHSLTLVAALTLGACANQVYSRGPLFEPDANAGAAIRAGVWATPERGCRFDDAAPLAEWPACAGGQIIAAGQVRWSGRGFALVLAGGAPMVLQLAREGKTRGEHWYYALGPARRDAEGRITAFDTWSVQCGPPPPPRQLATGEDETGAVTDRPLPGLTITGRNCRARSAEAVRNAAAPSRDWEDELVRSYWVRDGGG